MKSPFTGKEMSLQREWRTMKFRKEEFDVLFHFYKCTDTGEQFEDEQFAQLNYDQLVNQYRSKYGIPGVDEIKSIRERYGVSASKMSLILGLGTNSYRLYESGEIPSQSNARLIQMAQKPIDFKRMVELSQELDKENKENLLKRIEQSIGEDWKNREEFRIKHYLFGHLSTSNYTGYIPPNLDKFSQMILFFSDKIAPMKVKLCKLLFYADFLNFKRSCYSMSGLPYEAFQMGPVPYRFDGIFDYLVTTEVLKKEFEIFEQGQVGERFRPAPDRKFNAELFSGQELEILKMVAKRFAKTTTKEIIEISHQEKAWKDNQAAQGIIDYRLGFELIGI